MREAFVALVAAFAWAGAATLDAQGDDPLSALLAVFGCASVVLVPAVLVFRHGRTPGGSANPEAGAAVYGLGLSALPLAVLGKVLFEKTHHRALGGVTFAFVATGIVVATILFARRIVREPGWGTVPRLVLAVLALASTATVAVWLFGAVLTAPDALKVAAVDFTTGGVLLSMAARAPVERLPAWARSAAFGGLAAAAGGVLVFALNQDLRRHVADAAPVATFVVRAILF